MTVQEWQEAMDLCEDDNEFKYLMTIKPEGAGINALTNRQAGGRGIIGQGGGEGRPLLAKLQGGGGQGRQAIPRTGKR